MCDKPAHSYTCTYIWRRLLHTTNHLSLPPSLPPSLQPVSLSFSKDQNDDVIVQGGDGEPKQTEEEEEEEDLGITDVDEPIPLFTKPILCLPGELCSNGG